MKSNEIFNLIEKSFDEKKNSHAFLFVTNNQEKCINDIVKLGKYVNCNNYVDGCTCNICRTIDSGNNPDFIIVRPEGNKIKTESVENIINSFATKSSLNKYSMYTFENADLMNDSAGNKILKFLEEPSDDIVGFFVTDNLNGILPTIKSRCEIFNLNYEVDNIYEYLDISEEEYEKYFDLAFQLCGNLNLYPKYMLMVELKNYSGLEKVDIEFILNLIKKFYMIRYDFVVHGKNLDFSYDIINNIPINDLKVIVFRLKLLDNILTSIKSNVNKDLIVSKFFLEWR